MTYPTEPTTGAPFEPYGLTDGGWNRTAIHTLIAGHLANATDDDINQVRALLADRDTLAAANLEFSAERDAARAELETVRGQLAMAQHMGDLARAELAATRQQLLAEANRLMRRPSHPPAAPDTAWWLRRLAECPVCSGPKRETAGMVCQACGKDWGPPAGGKPGFWLDDDGQWQPLSTTPPETAGGEQA